MESKSIQENSALGGEADILPAKDGGPAGFKHKSYDAAREMAALGVPLVEEVEVRNQLTGERTTITVRHDGTTDSAVAITLADPKATREQKDAVVAAYLFETGKHNSSTLMDLWAYKGQHTKESRHWMSQMRFDFELFLETFRFFMSDTAGRVMRRLGMTIDTAADGTEILHFGSETDINDVYAALGDMAIYMRQTSELLKKRIENEKQKRDMEKGKGIYIGLDNRPYSIYEDEGVAEVVAADQAKAMEDKKKDND